MRLQLQVCSPAQVPCFSYSWLQNTSFDPLNDGHCVFMRVRMEEMAVEE